MAAHLKIKGINHIKWKNVGIENFTIGLINLIVEIKINPKILNFSQEGKKTMFKKDKVDHEIPNPPTIEGINKTIMPLSITTSISTWDNITSLLGELKKISCVTRIEYINVSKVEIRAIKKITILPFLIINTSKIKSLE